MIGSQAGTVVAVKVFMEQDVVTPVGIVLQAFLDAVIRTVTGIIAAEQLDQPLRKFIGNLTQGQVLARPGRTLYLKVVAVVMMKLLQRLDDQVVDREPD